MHAWLVWLLARREIAARYRGSLLGLGWSLASPLILLGIYAFVFSVVMGARWPGFERDLANKAYLVMLFSGLIMHGFLAECLNRAPAQILANVNLVKKVIFPLPVIALSQLVAAVFHFAVNLVVLAGACFIVLGSLPATAVLAPLVCLPMYAIGLGLMWSLSAFGVYVRDLGQLTGMAATALLFLSPALYPLDAVPESLRAVLMLNPLTWSIGHLRMVMVYGTLPPAGEWLMFSAVALAFVTLAGFVFLRLRRGFADVL